MDLVFPVYLGERARYIAHMEDGVDAERLIRECNANRAPMLFAGALLGALAAISLSPFLANNKPAPSNNASANSLVVDRPSNDFDFTFRMPVSRASESVEVATEDSPSKHGEHSGLPANKTLATAGAIAGFVLADGVSRVTIANRLQREPGVRLIRYPRTGGIYLR